MSSTTMTVQIAVYSHQEGYPVYLQEVGDPLSCIGPFTSHKAAIGYIRETYKDRVIEIC